MRRRRRNRSTWFPVLGTAPRSESGGLTSYYNTYTAAAADYHIDVQSTPLIPDITWDPAVQATDATLRDYVEGQTCIVERIVGKIVAGCEQRASSSPGTIDIVDTVIACAAIAVLPTRDDGSIDVAAAEYNPLLSANLDKPWLWRRTWVLANNEAVANTSGFFSHPASNEFFDSMATGPHIDTKGVKRAIQRNQRIFLILASVNNTIADPTEDVSVQWTVDLRVLGRMVKAKNKSLFT